VPSDRAWTRFSKALGARGLRATGQLNIPLYKLSGGRIGGRLDRAPILLLTTVGRRSGKERTAPVVYLRDGERMIVIGSNAGNKRPPAWALNLEQNPEAEVQVRRERWPVRARIAEGPEHDELWRRMNEQFSGFDDYRERTTRDIRLFVLEPR
jgi:deazaflavin-dependent oxidoreductase (nitroreductase family)